MLAARAAMGVAPDTVATVERAINELRAVLGVDCRVWVEMHLTTIITFLLPREHSKGACLMIYAIDCLPKWACKVLTPATKFSIISFVYSRSCDACEHDCYEAHTHAHKLQGL